ncbi:MAG: hypothetical protein NG737_00600 [Omnitrophica bacterium]|nr:hypothetical protein [Candidatus Omnitrophota bacterium]
MNRGFFILIFLVFFGLSEDGFCHSQDMIEIDLNNHRLKFVNFYLGDFKINGDFSFALSQDDGDLIFDLEGKDMTFADKKIPWLKVRLVKKGRIIFINQFSSPQLRVKGNINLVNQQLSLKIDSSFSGKFKTLQGKATLKMKLWGSFSDFLASGYLVAEDGKYKNKEFSKLRLDFFGKAPFFNITDSQLILKNGSVLKMEGVLDLRDFSNLLPGVEFVAEKIFFDKWQLFSENNESIVMKKSIDERVDIVLDANRDRNELVRPGAEVRYNLKDDKFLKLRMQESKTVLKFEKKKEF